MNSRWNDTKQQDKYAIQQADLDISIDCLLIAASLYELVNWLKILIKMYFT